MGVSRHSLDQIRQALDPLEILREAVPSLKQSGPRWKGLCPFHNERTPSFFYMPEKGLWHCFGACQEGGDVFKFVMRLENLSFPEALRALAQRAGVRLEWDRGGGSDESSRAAKERESLLDLLSEAAAFYHGALKSAADAEPARRLLARRRVAPKAVEEFQLGFIPGRNGFLDQALKRGVAIELLLKTGLAVRSEKTGRYHDALANRLCFPILDPYGQVVGFGGRTLEDEGPAPENGDRPQGPKYLNSPETPVYVKGRHLYGLFQGRADLRAKGQALLVEGYMDVVGCHQAGARRAVAPLGTAFTREQAQLLKRYVKEVVLLYDPDEAGARASWRSAQMILQEDLFVRVARLPDGLDPDDYILKEGPAALERAADQARDVVDFWLDSVEDASKSFAGLHGRVRQAEELIRLIQSVPNEILKREWLRKAARRLSLDESALRREMDKRSPEARPAPAARPAAPMAAPALRSAEEEVLQLLCRHPEAWPAAGLDDGLFGDLRCRAVYEKLKRQRDGGGGPDLPALLSDLNESDGRWLSSLIVEEKEFADPTGMLQQSVRRLKLQAAARERKVLEQDVLRMLEGKTSRDESKIARYQTLTREIKGEQAKA